MSIESLLAHLDELIFMLGGTVCHQLPERSLFVNRRQLPLCVRDTSIHLALWYSFCLAFFFNRKWLSVVSSRYIALALVLSLAPVGFDVLAYELGIYPGSNTVRFVTGLFAGFGIGLFVAKTLQTTLASDTGRHTASIWPLVLGSAGLLPIAYLHYAGYQWVLSIAFYLQGVSVLLIFTLLWGLFLGFGLNASGRKFPSPRVMISAGLAMSLVQIVILGAIRL